MTALALGLAAPAGATPVRIASYGSGPGKVRNPEGVAVDASGAGGVEAGTLYVADRNNHRIDRFGPAGDFQLAWGWGVADGMSHELQSCGPAALDSEGEPEPTKRCFAAAREAGGATATGPGAVTPGALAVDSEGDVYVADSSHRRITKFGPDGEFLFMAGKGVDQGGGTPANPGNLCTAAYLANGDICGEGLSGTGPGEFTAPASPALDPSGDLWVLDEKRVVELDSDGIYLAQAPLPGGIAGSGLAVDSTGDLHTVRLGVNEEQEIQFEGMSSNVSQFKLEDLPAGCAAATAPITYAAGAQTRSERISDALEAACGAGAGLEVAYGEVENSVLIRFKGKFEYEDASQFGCTVLTSPGGCPVATNHDGAPPGVLRLHPEGTPVSALSEVGTPLDEGGKPEALALDSEDNLYVGDRTAPYRLMVFDGGELASVFGAGQVIGSPRGNALAVDEGAARLYVASQSDTEAASVVQAFPLPGPGPLIEDQHVTEGTPGPTGATLAATLNPENEETAYRFEYDTAPYAAGEPEGEHGAQAGAGSLAASFEVADVETSLSGLNPDTTYHFRLCADNATASTCGPDTTFNTRTAVGIEAQWAAAVGARDAALRATLDPLGATEVTWWVRYGPGGALDHETAHLQLAGPAPLTVSASIEGLDPATAYSYRFVAHAGQDGHPYTVEGETHRFTTQPAGLGAALPDSRAWEMVSPPDKHGGLIRAFSNGAIQAAADGGALAYLSIGSLEADPEASGAPRASSTLARRGPGGAWAGRDLTPLHTEITAPLVLPEYKLFSADLGGALLEPVARHAALPGGGRTDPLPARQHRPSRIHPAG